MAVTISVSPKKGIMSLGLSIGASMHFCFLHKCCAAKLTVITMKGSVINKQHEAKIKLHTRRKSRCSSKAFQGISTFMCCSLFICSSRKSQRIHFIFCGCDKPY